MWGEKLIFLNKRTLEEPGLPGPCGRKLSVPAGCLFPSPELDSCDPAENLAPAGAFCPEVPLGKGTTIWPLEIWACGYFSSSSFCQEFWRWKGELLVQHFAFWCHSVCMLLYISVCVCYVFLVIHRTFRADGLLAAAKIAIAPKPTCWGHYAVKRTCLRATHQITGTKYVVCVVRDQRYMTDYSHLRWPQFDFFYIYIHIYFHLWELDWETTKFGRPRDPYSTLSFCFYRENISDKSHGQNPLQPMPAVCYLGWGVKRAVSKKNPSKRCEPKSNHPQSVENSQNCWAQLSEIFSRLLIPKIIHQ